MSEVLSLWKGRITPPNDATASKIIYEAARAYGLGPKDLRGASRAKAVTAARWLACWQLRQLKTEDGKTKYSYPKIARMIGLKDHTSVMHACRQFELGVTE